MTYCSGGDLFETMTKTNHLTEKEAANFMRQMVSAVHYLHSLGIAHCDLKPENFMVEYTESNAKLLLIDFGMAKIVKWRQYHKKMLCLYFYPSNLHNLCFLCFSVFIFFCFFFWNVGNKTKTKAKKKQQAWYCILHGS